MVGIAYIMTAYTDPEQFCRLVDRLNGDNVSFLVHIDRTAERTVARQIHRGLRSYPNCHFVKREPVRWGDFGVVQAILNAIDEMFDRNIDFDFAIHITGHCYPIKSTAQIKRRLERHLGEQLIECFPLPFTGWGNDSLDRLRKYHFWVLDRKYAYPPTKGGIQARLAHILLSPFLDDERRLPHGFEPYGGSFVWCLSRSCLRYIHDFVNSQTGQDLVRFYQHTFASDEMFFQTIVMNSHWGTTVASDNPWFIDWSAGGGHPAVLTVEEFGRLRTSERLFARKFSASTDADVLDLIDRVILGRSD